MDFFSRKPWYLAGGTALALQAGHRQSVDLDFFIPTKTFDEKKVEAYFAKSGHWMTTSIDTGTVYGELYGAKMSLIAYPFFTPSEPLLVCGTVSLVSPKDIAVMKIIAISQRGRKRDFFDLYWLCHHVQPLLDTLQCVHKQYTIKQNMVHILKSMVYFEDAEDDPEPSIYFRASWKTVKAFFRKEVVTIAEHLIR
jgi:predicted nucleotidyltransferase component of viral defense system